MTYVHNDPTDFRAQSIAGMIRAFPELLLATPGGVLAASTPAQPQVSVVVGGGSGHYPAFGGMVGPGMADAAVLGDVFASPSAGHVADVARAADQGRGILLSFGNYTGDVINFTAGAQMLRADGLDVRILPVTDDIASADVGSIGQRRGIAGDLAVFRIAGAAAGRGMDLDDVERLARKANHRTRTLGVAYTGCTLPGADAPLFELPPATMGIGMGIHGEPGLATVPRQPGAVVARTLVEKVLADLAATDLEPGRVIPIVNGLGALSSDELFIAYETVEDVLSQRGIAVMHPLVGTFCSSFDMAGFSITLFAPDDELLSLWTDPLDTPSLRFGAAPSPGGRRTPAHIVDRTDTPAAPVSAADANRAEQVAAALTAIADELARLEPELGRIDAVAGDGDHGIGMARGSIAAAETAALAVRQGHGAAATLSKAARAWIDRAGGTSGAIWGAMLSTSSQALTAEKDLETALVAATATGVTEQVRAMGGAEPGDKTIVDVLVPFAESLRNSAESKLPLATAWEQASKAAQVAAEETSAIPARRGRARTHGDASTGTPDPGCVSFAAVAATLGSFASRN